MEEIDIWRAAAAALKLYGDDAALKAAIRADELLDEGELKGLEVWKRIVKAINVLEVQRPEGVALD